MAETVSSPVEDMPYGLGAARIPFGTSYSSRQHVDQIFPSHGKH